MDISRCILHLVKLLLVVFLTASLYQCSSTKFEKIPENSLVTVLALDKIRYHPEEPIIATIQIQNLTDKPMMLPLPDIKSVVFYRLEKKDGDVFLTEPVFSPKESALNMEEIKGKEWKKRPFVLTNCTLTTGEFSLQAIYKTSGADLVEGRPQFVSVAYDYTVSGEASYHRDKKGILLKGDAIKIAEKKLGVSYKSVRADLVKNEFDCYEWWITFTLSDKNQKREEVEKAFYVNPYLCVVRKEAPPYRPPKPKETPIPIEALREKAKSKSTILNPTPK